MVFYYEFLNYCFNSCMHVLNECGGHIKPGKSNQNNVNKCRKFGRRKISKFGIQIQNSNYLFSIRWRRRPVSHDCCLFSIDSIYYRSSIFRTPSLSVGSISWVKKILQSVYTTIY